MAETVEHIPTEPRERLLLAAEELFARKGFDGATVREICERAGMNIAAINYHFGDKERLYVETVRFAHVCGFSRLAPMSWSEATPPERKLRDFIREMVQTMHGPVRVTSSQLMMREMANPSPAAETVIRESIQPMAFLLRSIVGELLPGFDERKLLMIGFSVVGQCLYYRQNRKVSEILFGKESIESLDLDLVTEHVTRFTLAALGLETPYPAQGVDR